MFWVLLVAFIGAVEAWRTPLLLKRVAIGSAILALQGNPIQVFAEDENIVMAPVSITELKDATKARPLVTKTQELKLVQPTDASGKDSYVNSLEKEKAKQDARKKLKSSKAYRNDLCESLGRGC